MDGLRNRAHPLSVRVSFAILFPDLSEGKSGLKWGKKCKSICKAHKFILPWNLLPLLDIFVVILLLIIGPKIDIGKY